MTYREILHKIISSLQLAYPDEPERKKVSEWLMCDLLEVDSTRLHLILDQLISDEYLPIIEQAIIRLQNGEPLQYVTGKAYFMDLQLSVRKGVLIPRPETEELVQMVMKHILNHPFEYRILDMCTGSGCIALALKKKFPDFQVFGLDVSETALQIAKENAIKNALSIQWMVYDLLNPLEAVLPECEIVVCNPPYVLQSEAEIMLPRVKCHEPNLALFVPDDDPLIFYIALFERLIKWKILPKVIFLECNPLSIVELQRVSEVYFPSSKSLIVKDFRANNRFLCVNL